MMNKISHHPWLKNTCQSVYNYHRHAIYTCSGTYFKEVYNRPRYDKLLKLNLWGASVDVGLTMYQNWQCALRGCGYYLQLQKGERTLEYQQKV